MSLFNDTETMILDGMFGSSDPGSYDLALSSTPPGEGGSNITEPSGNGYVRVPITNNATNFPAAPSGGPKTNGVLFAFPTSTGPWGAALGWWVLFSGATPIIYGTLSPAEIIDTGDTLRIPAGQMIITAE